MNPNRFRASFSVLERWSNGDWEGAVKQYFKLVNYTSEQMADGKRYHKEWQEYISKYKQLPEIFGGAKLNNPVCEEKVVIKELLPWLDLVGVPDCVDGDTIYEFKTGRVSSEQYANSFQGGIYGLIATYSNTYARKVVLGHYNQNTDRADVSYIWITDKLLKDTLNWVETLSAEMHSYFLKSGLYARFSVQPDNARTN